MIHGLLAQQNMSLPQIHYTKVLAFFFIASTWCSLAIHYSKSQIFVQKYNLDEFFTQIFFDTFSREIKVVNS